jgi:hypothetical protein
MTKMMTFGMALTTVLALHQVAFASPEVLTDRCSGEVAFTRSFNGKPTDKGTIILKRNGQHSPWTTVDVKPDGEGHVRWWCHSTTGNVFDPGTWRVHIDGNAITACLLSVGEAIVDDGATGGDAGQKCLKAIKITSSAFQGWTAERSRCNNKSGHLKARLGPDRLLQSECL